MRAMIAASSTALWRAVAMNFARAMREETAAGGLKLGAKVLGNP
jgi:hypothetical protein